MSFISTIFFPYAFYSNTVVSYSVLKIRESSISNKVFLIDHHMPDGEYFLVENRFSSSFDCELRHHTDKRWKDRMGAAVWHVDSTGLLGKDSKNRPIIDYRTTGYPGDGIFPAVHYMVALIQSDGRFQLEKSENRGKTRVRTTMCIPAPCSLIQAISHAC